MASIHLISAVEIAERDAKPKGRSGRRRSEERTRVIEQYKQVLRNAEPGSGGDVVLEPNEDKRIVRQNLKVAAQELNKLLEFRPIKDSLRIHFRVVTPEQHAAKPKRPGRPRKNP